MNMTIFMLYFMLSLIHISSINSFSYNKLKIYSLSWSLGGLLIFTFMCLLFNPNKGFQFIYIFEWATHSKYNWGSIMLAMDGMSLAFIGLSLILMPMMYIMSWNSINFLLKEYILSMHTTLLFLMILFSVLEIITFYIFFEILLMPVFMLMGVWGSSKQKTEASLYFFFYTLSGSFLMLLSMFKLYSITGITDYNYLLSKNMNSKMEYWMFLGFFISLSMKIPMIPFHLWLPKAHVEAPMSGSMLLAGMLLKLGGYGMMSFIIPLLPNSSYFFKPIILTLSFMAIIYGALATLKQNDVKKLMAYSSVSHMGLVTVAMFTFSLEGMMSSLVMMFAHGLVSSGLFMSTYILYLSNNTSALKYFKGLAMCMPMFSSMNLILILSNMGFPLTLNFIAEILCMKAMLKSSFFGSLLVCMGCFLTTMYSLFMYNSIHFGKFSFYLNLNSDMTSMEFYSFTPIIFFTLLLGLIPSLLFIWMKFPIYHMLALS